MTLFYRRHRPATRSKTPPDYSAATEERHRGHDEDENDAADSETLAASAVWKNHDTAHVVRLLWPNDKDKLPGPPARPSCRAKPGWRPRSASSAWFGHLGIGPTVSGTLYNNFNRR